ncbi:hypothetical protein MICAI_1080004 [Microcystis sp. T1-4]|nr:hypothetical protein MICAI_1080004 [Microcystis sp. T1-4]
MNGQKDKETLNNLYEGAHAKGAHAKGAHAKGKRQLCSPHTPHPTPHTLY